MSPSGSTGSRRACRRAACRCRPVRWASDGRDAQMFPDFYQNVLENNPFSERIRMAPRVCVGPIRYVGQEKLQRDIRNLKTAMAAAGADEGFMPSSAPDARR